MKKLAIEDLAGFDTLNKNEQMSLKGGTDPGGKSPSDTAGNPGDSSTSGNKDSQKSTHGQAGGGGGGSFMETQAPDAVISNNAMEVGQDDPHTDTGSGRDDKNK